MTKEERGGRNQTFDLSPMAQCIFTCYSQLYPMHIHTYILYIHTYMHRHTYVHTYTYVHACELYTVVLQQPIIHTYVCT